MVIRGHSDQANLALLYRGDFEPSAELQSENAIPIPPGTTYTYFGSRFQDSREAGDLVPFANTFKRNLKDIVGVPIYDTFVLEELPGHPTFQKTLISEQDPNPNLLCVTTASCSFSKPLPPVNMMSCYLIVG